MVKDYNILDEQKAREVSNKLRNILMYCKTFDEDVLWCAINEVEKAIPKYAIREKWKPNRCPTCWENLGGKCDDGYYENPHYENCPRCRQKLKYKGDN